MTPSSGENTGSRGGLLVVSAHAGDFVWRAGGAVALASSRGQHVTIICLSYGERGESARAWRDGKTLEEIKLLRREEAEAAAAALSAEIVFLDAGDYPLVESVALTDELVQLYRSREPSVVLTHTLLDPYNGDHPAAARMTLQARILAQAAGYDAPPPPLSAPPVFLFEPHQSEMCEFRPDVLLDITAVYERKAEAMRCLPAQEHMWEYYSDLARRRGIQLERNAGPNMGILRGTKAEAFMRVYPQATDVLG